MCYNCKKKFKFVHTATLGERPRIIILIIAYLICCVKVEILARCYKKGKEVIMNFLS